MISVVIPVYKKTEEFVKNLEHNLTFLKGIEVIVVNDDPSSSIASQLKKFEVKLIENKENLGFSGAANTGVANAKHERVFLLNSDVLLLDDSYKTAEKQFEKNNSLFAVSFAQKEKDGSIVGKNKVFWKRGLLHHSKADDSEEGDTGWAEGGAAVFDKKKFHELRGFNPLFSPFYWEDIDLSYRAKKKGFKIRFDPSVLVEHHHESTIGTYWSKQAIKAIAYRNQILCSWKHIEDTNILKHILYLKLHLLRSLVRGDFAFVKGYIKAFMLLFSPVFWR